jgi:hypothetical protein
MVVEMSRMLALTALLVFAVLAGSAARPPAAWACSCAGEPPETWLGRSDAAFVGEVLAWRVDRPPGPIWSTADPAYATFRVERAVKGTLSRELVVRTAASSASCGLGVHVGQRVALLLDRDGDEWTSGLCAQFEPREFESLRTAGRIEGRAASAGRASGGRTTDLLALGAAACAVAAGVLWWTRRRGGPEPGP